jgi:hypothetical protein
MQDLPHAKRHAAEHVGAGWRARLQPAMKDLVRVGCRDSNDHRAAVMQTSNSQALLDLQRTLDGPPRGRFPSMGSVAARFTDPQGRTHPIVGDGGWPISGLG